MQLIADPLDGSDICEQSACAAVSRSGSGARSGPSCTATVLVVARRVAQRSGRTRTSDPSTGVFQENASLRNSNHRLVSSAHSARAVARRSTAGAKAIPKPTASDLAYSTTTLSVDHWPTSGWVQGRSGSRSLTAFPSSSLVQLNTKTNWCKTPVASSKLPSNKPLQRTCYRLRSTLAW